MAVPNDEILARLERIERQLASLSSWRMIVDENQVRNKADIAQLKEAIKAWDEIETTIKGVRSILVYVAIVLSPIALLATIVSALIIAQGSP